MSPGELSLLIILGAAALAFLMRMMSTKKEPDAVDRLLAEVSSGEAGDIAALTSDGVAFVPRGDGIALVPAGRPVESELNVLGSGPGRGRTAETLIAAELIAARVKRGAPDHDPWRLEALGRDREYRAWRFETEEAAQAALRLVDERIVRSPRDENGDAVRIGDADFAEARRVEEETERELASGVPYEEDPRDERI
jgi:hypothetical protein